MPLTTDPIASVDGTAATVASRRSQGEIKTYDEQVLEVLNSINNKLGAIQAVLEFEFEMQGETVEHGED